MSFTVDVRYCGDTLVDFPFIQQAETCGMDMSAMATSENSSLSQVPLYGQQNGSEQGQDDLKITFDQHPGATAFITS
jgi:hypothetical protein